MRDNASYFQWLIDSLKERWKATRDSRGPTAFKRGFFLAILALVAAIPLAAYMLQEPAESTSAFLSGFLSHGVFTLIHTAAKSVAPYLLPIMSIASSTAAAFTLYQAAKNPTKTNIARAGMMTSIALLANIGSWGMIAGAAAIPAPVLFLVVNGLCLAMGVMDAINLAKRKEPPTFQEKASIFINLAQPALAITLMMLTSITPAGPLPLLVTIGVLSAALVIGRFVLKWKRERRMRKTHHETPAEVEMAPMPETEEGITGTAPSMGSTLSDAASHAASAVADATESLLVEAGFKEAQPDPELEPKPAVFDDARITTMDESDRIPTEAPGKVAPADDVDRTAPTEPTHKHANAPLKKPGDTEDDTGGETFRR